MFIYKITNIKNNKIYIGLTTRNPDDRFKEHIKMALSGKGFFLHSAIRKYGIENFIFDVIYETESIEDLKEKEKYFITKFNSYNRNFGYNLTPGGDGVLEFNCIPVLKIEIETGKVVKEYESISKAEEENGRRVQECISNRDKKIIVNGHTFYKKEYVEKAINIKEEIFSRYDVLLQIDLEGNFLRYWSNIQSAADSLKIEQSNISSNIANKRVSAGGFQWSRYNNEDKIGKKSRKATYNKKGVYQLNYETKEIIQKFESIAEASRETGAVASKISMVCNGKRNKAGGFGWIKESDATDELCKNKN